MKSNSNDKRTQLDDYLAKVQDAERKKKRRNALVVLLLATVGLGVATGVWYFNEKRVIYRTFIADDMTIYKMDSIFRDDKKPVILTYRYEDREDTVNSVDEYLTLDGVINASTLDEENMVAIDDSELLDDSTANDMAGSSEIQPEENTEMSKPITQTEKRRESPKKPTLQRYIFDVAGNRVAGEELAIKIEDYNAKIVYVLDFGNGQKQRVRENKRYTYQKAGNYNVKLIATSSNGARSIYSKSISIDPAVETQKEITESKATSTDAPTDKTSNSTVAKSETPSQSSDEPITEDPLTITEKEKSEIPVEKESKATPRPGVQSTDASNSAPLTFAEKMPSFPGGAKSMYKFLNKQLKYPSLARDNEVQGKVYIQFLVDADGSLSQFKVARGLGFGCDEEALRIAKLMPKWVPGEHGGRKVPVIYTLAVNYKF